MKCNSVDKRHEAILLGKGRQGETRGDERRQVETKEGKWRRNKAKGDGGLQREMKGGRKEVRGGKGKLRFRFADINEAKRSIFAHQTFVLVKSL